MYSWLYSILSLFSVIFLLLRSCVSQELSALSDSLIPDSCRSSTTNSWWKPLELNGHDPCGLGHQLMLHGIHFGCCSVESGTSPNSGSRNEAEGCNSCNLPTYNIAMACSACNSYPNATTEDLKTAISNQSLYIPTVQQWDAVNQFESQTSINPILLPPWASVPVANSIFNVEGIVQNASESLSLAGLPVSISIAPSMPASPASLPGGQVTFVPSNAPTSTSNPQTNLKTSANASSRAGSIAGGVLGGMLALALVALAVLYLIRRRNRLHMAPSAEFMPVVVPGAKHMGTQGDFPSHPGMWNGPVLEKVHSASTMEREFASGTLSKVHTWDYDSERV